MTEKDKNKKKAYTYPFTVRGYELDSFGHVNNAVYLNYFEQARWEILREEGLKEKFIENGWFLVVTQCNVRYHREARMFDELEVQTSLENESPYLIFKQKIYNRTDGLKVTTAVFKTLLLDNDRRPNDILPELFNL